MSDNKDYNSQWVSFIDSSRAARDGLPLDSADVDIVPEKIVFPGGKIKFEDAFKDYYKLRETAALIMDNMANLLPYTLDLTIYGIGSVVPGDTFRVDYLPKIHLYHTYHQVMRVTQTINSGALFTIMGLGSLACDL